MKKSVILLSGGLDSTTCLAIAKQKGYTCYALSFNYGQRHAQELIAARNVAQQLGVVEHRVVKLDVGQFGGSALTDATIDVPTYKNSSSIPVTYVPARNTIFLAIALGFAEVLGAEAIFVGVNAIDYSHYPDCRPEFIEAFQALANVATKKGVEGQAIRIEAPLMHLSKREIIQQGLQLGIDYGMTVSCYQLNEEGQACGECDSCSLRRQGFEGAGVIDPTHYL